WWRRCRRPQQRPHRRRRRAATAPGTARLRRAGTRRWWMPSSPESDTQATPATDQAQPDNGELAAELERIEDRYKRGLPDLDKHPPRRARGGGTRGAGG